MGVLMNLKSIQTFVFSFLRKSDFLGQPVTLNYKKVATYQTPIGGFFSFIVLALISAYLYSLIRPVIVREQYTVQTTSLTRLLEDVST